MASTTSAEQTIVRGKNYRPRKFLSIVPDTTFMSGTVLEVHTDTDTGSIYELVLSGVTGAYATTDLTMYVGTTPGARDIGKVRCRNSADATGGTDYVIIQVGAISPGELPIAVGHYATVKYDYRPFQLDYRLKAVYTGGVITDLLEYLDYDKDFGAPHYGNTPKANITAGTITQTNGDTSPELVKLAGWVDGYYTSTPQTYRTLHLSSAYSFATTYGKGIASAFWVIGDGTIITGSTTTTEIDVTFPVGFRYIWLLVNDDDGYQQTMRLPIWVHDDTYPPLYVDEIEGDETEHWREMTVNFFGDVVDETVIPQGAGMCYWELPEFEDGDPPQAYRDQAYGWVMQDTPLLRRVDSRYTVSFAGAGWWLDHFDGPTQALRDTHTTPARWWDIDHLTIDRVIMFSMLYYTTVAELVCVFLNSGVLDESDDRDVTPGTLWSQMVDNANRSRFCTIGSDSLGNIWLEREYNHRNPDERIGVLPLLRIEATDLTSDGLALQTHQAPDVSLVKAKGSIDNSGDHVIYASIAPGRTRSAGTNRADMPGQYLPLSNPQTILNWLSGLHWAFLINDQPEVPAPLLDNLDVVEPCWQRPIEILWTESTIRGTVLQSVKFMVKRVSITHSNEEGSPPKQITWTLSKVTVGNPGQLDPVTQQTGITVPSETACAPTASFTSVPSGCDVAFTDTSTGVDLYMWYWDFGDGSYSISQNPAHGFATAGDHTVTLTVLDRCGVADTYSTTVTTTAETVTAGFTSNIYSPTVDFTDISTADSGVAAWSWDFGDGDTSTEQNPSHDYATANTYTVTLTITSVCGAQDVYSTDVTTTAGIVPIADFPLDDTAYIFAGQTITICGNLGPGTFEAGSGQYGQYTIHKHDGGANLQCSGVCAQVVPASGSWIVTQVRIHVKYENPSNPPLVPGHWRFRADYGGSRTNVYNSGLLANPYLDEGVWGWYHMPWSYAGAVTSVYAQVSVENSSAGSAPQDWYIDHVEIYGTAVP